MGAWIDFCRRFPSQNSLCFRPCLEFYCSGLFQFALYGSCLECYCCWVLCSLFHYKIHDLCTQRMSMYCLGLTRSLTTSHATWAEVITVCDWEVSVSLARRRAPRQRASCAMLVVVLLLVVLVLHCLGPAWCVIAVECCVHYFSRSTIYYLQHFLAIGQNLPDIWPLVLIYWFHSTIVWITNTMSSPYFSFTSSSSNSMYSEKHIN